jgi:hypothetical protein
VNRRSKNALWTVSPSASKTTRKVPILHFLHLSPTPNPTVGLDLLVNRSSDSSFNPFVTNHRPIGASADCHEIGGHLHVATVANRCEAARI